MHRRPNDRSVLHEHHGHPPADELKARVAEAAKRAGTISRNFFLEAIAGKAAQAEARAGLDAEAEQRYARIVESGQTTPWDEMRRYLEDRAVLSWREVGFER